MFLILNVLPNQAELEKLLLAWIQHHDSTHGGRIHLPDNIILEQAKLIAAEARLVFDPNEFNFSTKWCTASKPTITSSIPISSARAKPRISRLLQLPGN